MKGYRTSFVGAFSDDPGSGTPLSAIEIPSFQRDYAQGRHDDRVSVIRANFLDVLCEAVQGEDRVSLDFVYGEISSSGVLEPLDGQQRLTALFLLHWYLAAQTDRLNPDARWASFTYETRPSARSFCVQLAKTPVPRETDSLSTWFRDQEWFLYTWNSDPTINSMLTVVEELHLRLVDVDHESAWRRLTDVESPAVEFFLLPIEDMGLEEELYIKMNSRGKPLTDFENFKAGFERVLEEVDPKLAREVAFKIDGSWTNLLWDIRGDDDIVDDEFMRYFLFATEVAEWRDGAAQSGRLDPRAEMQFGVSNPAARERLKFLCDGLDVWEGDFKAVTAEFESIFVLPNDAVGRPDSKVVLHGEDHTVNLLEKCCRSYGTSAFTVAQVPLLYGVLHHRINETEAFARRARVLRNLVAASLDELRRSDMQRHLSDVDRVIGRGDIEGVQSFNQFQKADELAKRDLIEAHPDLARPLFALEDHPFLRGSLMTIDFDPERLIGRRDAFRAVFDNKSNWTAATGAMLALGEYQRARRRARSFQFGSATSEAAWRQLLTGTSRENMGATRSVLTQLLDFVAASSHEPAECMDSLSREWLLEQEAAQKFDWRHYLVKYAPMRTGESGIYFSEGDKMGYSLGMMKREKLNSFYKDPYLFAIWSSEDCDAERIEEPSFRGYLHEPRWMRLKASGVSVRCQKDAWGVRVPQGQGLDAVPCESWTHQDENEEFTEFAVSIEQRDGVDSEDRIKRGSELVRRLVDAGL